MSNDLLFCTTQNGFKLSDVKTWEFNPENEVLTIKFFSGLYHQSIGLIAKNLLSFLQSQCIAVISEEVEQEFNKPNDEIQDFLTKFKDMQQDFHKDFDNFDEK